MPICFTRQAIRRRGETTFKGRFWSKRIPVVLMPSAGQPAPRKRSHYQNFTLDAENSPPDQTPRPPRVPQPVAPGNAKTSGARPSYTRPDELGPRASISWLFELQRRKIEPRRRGRRPTCGSLLPGHAPLSTLGKPSPIIDAGTALWRKIIVANTAAGAPHSLKSVAVILPDGPKNHPNAKKLPSRPNKGLRVVSQKVPRHRPLAREGYFASWRDINATACGATNSGALDYSFGDPILYNRGPSPSRENPTRRGSRYCEPPPLFKSWAAQIGKQPGGGWGGGGTSIIHPKVRGQLGSGNRLLAVFINRKTKNAGRPPHSRSRESCSLSRRLRNLGR